MDGKNINGSILMHKGVRSVACETKLGYLKHAEISVRLTNSIEFGL
jgi:hypothetical protein